MHKPLAFCLMGPTAAGKTDLACEIVKRFPCEIISVDSAMIYRHMNIGTAKPDAVTLARAPHHLLDIVDPSEHYSVAQFCQDTQRLCVDIWQRGRIPLLVGGTMMYFRALQFGLAALPAADSLVREQLLAEALLEGWPYMHAKLVHVDPIAATKIHPHDSQRIQRALEVYTLTGQPLSTLLTQEENQSYQFHNLLLLPQNRAWLHQRINERFAHMLIHGLIEEVEGLLANWSLTLTHPAMRCVGYRQTMEYLLGHYDKETLLAKGSAATRQLAKRQLTWLRHWPNGTTFIAEESTCGQEMMAKIAEILDN